MHLSILSLTSHDLYELLNHCFKVHSISAVECSLCFRVVTLPVEMTYQMFTLLGFDWSDQPFVRCILYSVTFYINILSVSVEKQLATFCVMRNIELQEKKKKK